MSAGSPKFTISRVAALSLVSLWLAGCTSSNNAPAPVSSVNGTSGSGNTSSGMLITPPPKMGTSTAQQTPQIQPVQRPVTQPTQIQPVEQPVQTENGRIVYNRKYGNIPKGSYTGGSTYTVKRGDTLFYIAGSPGTISAIWHSETTSGPVCSGSRANASGWQRDGDTAYAGQHRFSSRRNCAK